MFDTQFLQIQFKLDFHWCASDKMSTKQIFKCLLCRHNRQQQIQRDGWLPQSSWAEFWLFAEQKCLTGNSTRTDPLEAYVATSLLTTVLYVATRKVVNFWTSKSSLIAVQTAYLSLQKACLWNETQTWCSCCPSGTILPQSELQQNNITVVQPSETHFSHVNWLQGSVLFPRQALSLKPVTFDPSPQLTLLQRVSRGSSWYATLL